MGYVDKHLISGEQIVLRSSLHWIIFLRSSFFLVVGVAGLVASLKFGEETQLILRVLGIAFAGIGLIDALAQYIHQKCNEFAVTNKRVVIKTGLVARQTNEMLLNKVESIDVSQSICGRIFGYGTITVGGTGGSKDTYASIDDPLGFRRTVQEQTSLQK